MKLFSELLFYTDECKLKIDNDLDRKLYNIIDYSSNNKLNNWIKGEKENELLYNMTLTYDERIKYQNTIEIENINIINEDMAQVTIKYGDIIGDTLTDETFETGVEFNNNTKFYSKGNDINSIKNLENAKGNINSIRLEKNTINKKNFPIVKTYER